MVDSARAVRNGVRKVADQSSHRRDERERSFCTGPLQGCCEWNGARSNTETAVEAKRSG
jgi:hypothetical protein